MKKVGIIVGRFQSADYHEGYKELIKIAHSTYDKVIVFLGVSPRKVPTKTDPLSFLMRVHLFEDAIRETISERAIEKFTFHMVHDNRCDKTWSQSLDNTLSTILANHSWSLNYSLQDCEFLVGKDSFAPYYSGVIKFNECPTLLDNDIPANSTEKRESVVNEIKELERSNSCTIEEIYNMAKGIIYCTQKQYDRVDPTVDIIPYYIDEVGTIWVAMGRKATDDKWRFCGGFVDSTDANYELAAIRELYEEMSMEVPIEEVKYVGNCIVKDWRYRKGNDSIRTTLFAVEVGLSEFFNSKACDDLAEVHVFQIQDVHSNIVEEHVPLLNLFGEYVDDL